MSTNIERTAEVLAEALAAEGLLVITDEVIAPRPSPHPYGSSVERATEVLNRYLATVLLDDCRHENAPGLAQALAAEGLLVTDEQCQTCNGSGWADKCDDRLCEHCRRCPDCQGSGRRSPASTGGRDMNIDRAAEVIARHWNAGVLPSDPRIAQRLAAEGLLVTDEPCDTCGGLPCDKCNGSGLQVEEHEPWIKETVACGWCNGEQCPDCLGSGRRNTLTDKHLAIVDERSCRRHNEHWFLGRHPDPARRSKQYDRHRAPEPLFTSGRFADGCLTHLVRFITEDADGHVTATSFCGAIQCVPRWVTPSEETFICIRCHHQAEMYSIDTFGLIPDSGCAITGGKRGRKLSQTHHQGNP